MDIEEYDVSVRIFQAMADERGKPVNWKILKKIPLTKVSLMDQED